MSKMIQLRNVPDGLHRSLKARAGLAGMSLSDYLLVESKEVAEKPTLTELRERLHKRGPLSAPIDTAYLVREERDAQFVLRLTGFFRQQRDRASRSEFIRATKPYMRLTSRISRPFGDMQLS